jgi:hypothetical protein
MGASPDDDFHLASVWCANDARADTCSAGPTATERTVPEAVVDAGCYVRQPEKSASCQSTDFSFDPRVTAVTDRGNFLGGYPPVYYAIMNLFIGGDILASVVVMRLVSVLLFVALASALFVLLPRPRRPALAWGWMVSTIPLGLFLIPSNNPSSWAIIGVGISWLALLGWFETTGRRKVGLGVLFAIATIMAAGARSDAAVYAVLGIGVVGILTFQPNRRYLIDAILPAAFSLICVLSVLTSSQSMSAVDGFTGSGTGADVATAAPNPIGLLAYNVLNVPYLWSGSFGTWALGWFDTAMPAVVGYGSLACFVVVAFVGFGSLNRRKAIALAVIGAALIAIPVYVLTAGGDPVGVEVQPRYLLPLIVMFAGVLVLHAGARAFRLSRGQLLLLVSTLAVVQFVALHTTMRRYITGVDGHGWNLNAGIEWWWPIPFSPMAVLIVGSLAFAALIGILAIEVSGKRSIEVVADRRSV